MTDFLGVDVSIFQDPIDWPTFAQTGKFAIIREGYGDIIDPDFARNRDQARQQGVPRGFYHYAYPNLNTGAAEARSMAANVGSILTGESLWLDMEQDYSVTWANAFLSELDQLIQFSSGIYLNLSAVRSFDWSPIAAGNHGLWLAFWDDLLTIPGVPWWSLVAMKQFFDRGSAPGIRGYVDTDVFNGTLEQFLKYGKPASAPQPAPAPTPPVPTPPPPQPPAPAFTWYTVVAGDTMSGIAARLGISLAYFEAINRDLAPNPNLIRVGQRLRIPGHSQPAPRPPAPARAFHTVVRGDTLTSIAAAAHLTLARLLSFPENAIFRANPNLIFVGQRVRIA